MGREIFSESATPLHHLLQRCQRPCEHEHLTTLHMFPVPLTKTKTYLLILHLVTIRTNSVVW